MAGGALEAIGDCVNGQKHAGRLARTVQDPEPRPRDSCGAISCPGREPARDADDGVDNPGHVQVRIAGR